MSLDAAQIEARKAVFFGKDLVAPKNPLGARDLSRTIANLAIGLMARQAHEQVSALIHIEDNRQDPEPLLLQNIKRFLSIEKLNAPIYNGKVDDFSDSGRNPQTSPPRIRLGYMLNPEDELLPNMLSKWNDDNCLVVMTSASPLIDFEKTNATTLEVVEKMRQDHHVLSLPMPDEP